MTITSVDTLEWALFTFFDGALTASSGSEGGGGAPAAEKSGGAGNKRVLPPRTGKQDLADRGLSKHANLSQTVVTLRGVSLSFV